MGFVAEAIQLFAPFSQTSSWWGIFWSQKTKDRGKLPPAAEHFPP